MYFMISMPSSCGTKQIGSIGLAHMLRSVFYSSRVAYSSGTVASIPRIAHSGVPQALARINLRLSHLTRASTSGRRQA